MSKLKGFLSYLRKSKPEADAISAPGQAETYHGQVLEREEDDQAGNDADWFAGKLKFKKHIDVRNVVCQLDCVLVCVHMSDMFGVPAGCVSVWQQG
jgi:hypothetical protein